MLNNRDHGKVYQTRSTQKGGCGLSETKYKYQNTYWREIGRNPDGT